MFKKYRTVEKQDCSTTLIICSGLLLFQRKQDKLTTGNNKTRHYDLTPVSAAHSLVITMFYTVNLYATDYTAMSDSFHCL